MDSPQYYDDRLESRTIRIGNKFYKVVDDIGDTVITSPAFLQNGKRKLRNGNLGLCISRDQIDEVYPIGMSMQRAYLEWK